MKQAHSINTKPDSHTPIVVCAYIVAIRHGYRIAIFACAPPLEYAKTMLPYLLFCLSPPAEKCASSHTEQLHALLLRPEAHRLRWRRQALLPLFHEVRGRSLDVARCELVKHAKRQFFKLQCRGRLDGRILLRRRHLFAVVGRMLVGTTLLIRQQTKKASYRGVPFSSPFSGILGMISPFTVVPLHRGEFTVGLSQLDQSLSS